MDYFPLGLAGGAAFCNRESEREHLLYNILHAKPTLITSPRRYGKTSLALDVINTHQIPFAYIDFFSDISQSDIETGILSGVGAVILKIIPAPQRAIKSCRKCLMAGQGHFISCVTVSCWNALRWNTIKPISITLLLSNGENGYPQQRWMPFCHAQNAILTT